MAVEAVPSTSIKSGVIVGRQSFDDACQDLVRLLRTCQVFLLKQILRSGATLDANALTHLTSNGRIMDDFKTGDINQIDPSSLKIS